MKSQSYDYIIGRLRNELEEIRQSEISIDHATNQVKELVKNAKVPFDYEQTAYGLIARKIKVWEFFNKIEIFIAL